MISDKDVIELTTNNSYDTPEIGTVITVNNNPYVVEELFNENTGMTKGVDAMLLRNSDGEYCLVFAGSDQKNDFFKDWVISNGSNVLKLDVPQYKEGLDLVNDITERGITLNKIGGVSLGGGTVGYIGMHRSEIDVISINPAPQTVEMTSEYENITNVIMNNDLLYNMLVISKRDDMIPGKIVKFNRGNEFREIRLNHLGVDEISGRFLDEQLPLDLMSGNFISSDINIEPEEVSKLNHNFLNSFYGYESEYYNKVLPVFTNYLQNYNEKPLMEDMIHNVNMGMKSYISSALPTLHSHFEFTHYFDEISSLTDGAVVNVINSLLGVIYEELNITDLKEKLVNDCNIGISNFSAINTNIIDNTNSVAILTDNMINRDNNIKEKKVARLEINMLSNGVLVNNVKYLILFEKAIDVCNLFLNGIIKRFTSTIDLKIDVITGTVKGLFSVVTDIVGIISKEVKKKFEVIERILHELHELDVSGILYNYVKLILNELIAIVLPNNVDDLIRKQRYLGGIINNISIVQENYLSYLSVMKSFGLTQIIDNCTNFNSSMLKYENYVNKIYL